MDAWISSDPAHVVVINSQSNMSRSFMLAAEYLCFCRKKYKEPLEALDKLCEEKRFDKKLLLASQKLYMEYFSKVMHGFIVLNIYNSLAKL